MLKLGVVTFEHEHRYPLKRFLLAMYLSDTYFPRNRNLYCNVVAGNKQLYSPIIYRNCKVFTFSLLFLYCDKYNVRFRNIIFTK